MTKMSGAAPRIGGDQQTLVLRSLPYLDEKWLRADLYGALQNTEDLAILWNNLVRDHELVVASAVGSTGTLNSAGNLSYSDGTHHYCGVQKLTCPCCSGYCRPTSACNCLPCQQLDEEPHPPKRHASSHAHSQPHGAGGHSESGVSGGLLSDSILDSWLWGPIPTPEDKAACIKALMAEQRDISLNAAAHSLSAIHMKQRLFVYQRYFLALTRFRKAELEVVRKSPDAAPVDSTLQNCQLADSISLKDAEKATLGLARVGTRAALNFSFAFLRRAWRSGEDTDLCSELLLEALEALQGLPEASLFDTSLVSTLWIEVLERSIKFLRQVVLGDVMGGRCLVPRADRHIALSLLMELGSQKGTLSATLEVILLLLTVWEKDRDSDDNRAPTQPNGAPLVSILRRYRDIAGNANVRANHRDGADVSPTDAFLGAFVLPAEETDLVDLKQTAVVIGCHLDRLVQTYLPSVSTPNVASRQKQSQHIFILGCMSISSDKYGFTAEPIADFPLLGDAEQQYSASMMDIGSAITVEQIVCSEKSIWILSAKGEVFCLDLDTCNEQRPRLVDEFGAFPVTRLAAHCEGKHLLALNSEKHVFSWGIGEGGRLGHGDTLAKTMPTRIQFFEEHMAIEKIYCGAAYSAAVSSTGILYTWGRGFYGSLGHGSSEDILIPRPVQMLVGQVVVDVALGSGDSHSLCVTEDGDVYGWGDNDFGKLGNGSCMGSHFPVQIGGLTNVVRIYSGSQFSVALTGKGKVYTWGKSHGGRLGHHHDSSEQHGSSSSKSIPEYCNEPRIVEGLDAKTIVDVAVGSAHCLALTTTGEVYGWGRNDFHQICPPTVSRDAIIRVPFLVTPTSLRISGLACGAAQSIMWRQSAHFGLPTRVPFVVDLTEQAFRFIDQLLGVVCPNGTNLAEPSPETECITVACLNVLRLQLHALIINNIDPKDVGLNEGSRLVNNLKTRLLALAGGSTIHKTMQDTAQWTLQVGWSVFLPTASERAHTLTALLPSEPGASTSGHRFMTDLLVSSLMAEEGLQTALRQAINAEPDADTSSGHNLPLLHLIKQLLRNNSALTQARLCNLSSDSFRKRPDADDLSPDTPSPSLDLLHRFQRLLLSHIHQSKIDDKTGAEALLGKYIHHVVSLSVVSLSRAHEVASAGKVDGIVDVLSVDISNTLLYELLLGLVLLHQDHALCLVSFDWSKHFVPLLTVLDHLNRSIVDPDVQDSDDLGWPAIVCRGAHRTAVPVPAEESVLLRQSDMDNHLADGGEWIVMNGYVYDVQDYHCDNPQTAELLRTGRGTDLTAELNAPAHRAAAEYIANHLKIGKYSFNDQDEKPVQPQCAVLTHLYSERTLAYLLGVRSMLLQKGPVLQPDEIQCKSMLKSAMLRGGLQVLQPTNPFDEEKGEARSSASTAGSTPTETSMHLPSSEPPPPSMWPHLLVTHRVDSLLSGLGDARLTDPAVAAWLAIVERYCKQNNLIWHQDFPPEHPISELERLLTAVFIHHQSIGPLVLAVVDRELSGSTHKLPAPVSSIIKLVHATKWTLIKTRQQLNRSYKEVCTPMLDKCRFLLYEVRPAFSNEQSGLSRLNILHKPPRFRTLVRRIIAEIQATKKMTGCAKPGDILNATIQSHAFNKNVSNENLAAKMSSSLGPVVEAVACNKSTSLDNLVTCKVPEVHPAEGDSNVRTEKNDDADDPDKVPPNVQSENNSRDKGDCNSDEQFINNVINRMSEKCVRVSENGPPVANVMSLIVDFVLQDACDVETLRRAMFCQVQRYQIRKQGVQMFTELLDVPGLLDAVQYNILSGYMGLFMDKPKQSFNGNILDDLNMITAFQKADLILSHSRIIEWTIGHLQKFVNEEQVYGKPKYHAGKDNSNLGTYVFLKKLPRARFLLSVFGILSRDFGPNEISLVVDSGALGCILGLLRQTGGDSGGAQAQASVCAGNELSYVFEDSISKQKAVSTNVVGTELAKLMKIGTRIVRGADWKWGEQDGPPPGEGRIISEVGEDGWVRVEWDNGATNSYRMGKEGQYDLRLADTFTLVTPDTETEEDGTLSESQLTAASHPTKLLRNACTKMLKIFSVSVGRHANKMGRSAVRNVAAMFRAILVSSKVGAVNLGLEHWTTLGFLRAISSDRNFATCLTTPAWIELHIEIMNGVVTSEQDIYKKLQSVRLLQATLEIWQTHDDNVNAEIIQRLFQVLGRIVLLCPNDLSLLQNPADVKARVLLSSSHSGTIAEEVISLLRKLHTMSAWNSAINAFVSQKLYMATEMLGETISKDIDDKDKSAVLSTLTLIGGCDPRPRIGLTITLDGHLSTICNFTYKGKALLSVHKSSEVKKVPIGQLKDSLDVGSFSFSRLSLNEMLLNSWSILLTGPGVWKTTVLTSSIDTQLLRSQQIHLAALNATSVLFRHQSSLRKILRQRAPGLNSNFASDESISEHDDELNNEPAGAALNASKEDTTTCSSTCSNLIETILNRATQTNPLKAYYTYNDLAMAALNLTQHLASHIHNELTAPTDAANRIVPLPVQPTLIHGIPIYNNEPLDSVPISAAEQPFGGGKPRKTTVPAHVTQIMEMGFTQASVELALLKLAPNSDASAIPTVEQIVQWILEHPAECPVVPSSTHTRSNDFDGDTDSDSGSSDTVEGGSSFHDGSSKYAVWSDFKTPDQYAMYVRGLVVPGMLVKCCRDFEEIRKGDMGHVLKVDTEGLHDLNVQVDWQMHGATYWMRFVHVELLEPPSAKADPSREADTSSSEITIGSHVRIRPNVVVPCYSWGSVMHGSIGVVTAIENRDVTVDFPQQFNWTGQLSEMELVCQGNPDSQLHGEHAAGQPQGGDTIDDWSRCIRTLTVSSNELSAKHLLDKSPNFWYSTSGTGTLQGRHWVRLEMHENVLVHSLAIVVSPADFSHMPALVVIRAGDSVETLKDFSWVSVKPTDTCVQLLSDVRQYYQWVEIVIKQCRNNGINCKIHGINITGRRRQTDIDLMLMNASFLSTEFDPTRESSTTSFPCDDRTSGADQSQCKVLVWGLNDKEQLGGLKGSKVKVPSLSLTLSQLRPVHLSGGSKSLFVVSQDGKVYACGEGTNGRLGLGHNYNVSTPRKVPILSQYVVKKVAVHSGGKHAMALTLDGKVFSWGEGEDGKLGHGNRITLDKPKLIESLRPKRIRDIACGSSHSAAITSSGELFTWGLGEYGRLGHGDNTTQLKPKLVQALLAYRVVQVACGSRDAQTLALTEEGYVFSWGDGDFGKLGRGGSEGCSVPHQVERLYGVEIIQIECGAQFSLALSKAGEVWTWGKGDYYRLGHGSDQHVRKPTPIHGLRGKKVIHVAVGALHCLAVTETGQVFAWGDNDHGQQGSGNTVVNKKPMAVVGLDNVFVNRVACGSSHSVAWSLPQSPAEENKKEPVVFAQLKDPLGSNSLGIYDSELQAGASAGFAGSSGIQSKPSLSEILLSLESRGARQIALNYVLNAMSIIQARQCIVAALTSHSQLGSFDKITDSEHYFKELEELHSPGHSPRNPDVIAQGGGEGLADVSTLVAQEQPSTPDSEIHPSVLCSFNAAQFHSTTGSMSLSTSISSCNATQRHSKMSVSAMSVMAATMTHQDEVINDNDVIGLDEFTTLLGESEAKSLVELLKLSVAGRTGPATTTQTIASTLIALGIHSPAIGAMLLETCITELEDLCTSRHFLGKIPKPVVQETSHPYIDDITLVGHVRIPGAESLRLEFDSQCSTEKRNDPLIIMDGSGRVIATRSGREYAQWAPEIKITGDEMRWKFTSDSSVNGWGWKFWVHAVMPPFFLQELGADRAVLSQPSMDLVMALLDSRLTPNTTNLLLRLAAALAACTQLNTLTTHQRIWAVKKLDTILKSKHSPGPLEPTLTAFLTPIIPSLLKQYEYEESLVRSGVHLMHTEYFKTLAALACDMKLDTLLPTTPTDVHKWAWFRRYCAAVRVAQSLINRTPLPRAFIVEVRKKIQDMMPNGKTGNGQRTSLEPVSSTSTLASIASGPEPFVDADDECTHGDALLIHEDHTVFKTQHDRQLLQWLNRRPEDWALSWGGASTIYGWGHNHRGQLGGLEGGRIKTPTPCESLSLLRPIQLCGGEQTLYAVTPDGKLFATGYGAGGRLGIGGMDSVSTPMLVESLQHVFIKKVAVNSGGKHCLALTAEGEVYSWGEGEDGKLGHGNRHNCDRPKLIEALSNVGVVDIACGSAHSACITATGDVMTWGKGRYGRLGHGDSEDQLRPKLVEAVLGFRAVDIACGSGDAQTVCITDDDNVWSWGDGDYGKLGRGGSDGCKFPVKIESLAGLGVIKVECGSQFSVALTRSGAVYTWGKGDYHRLGHGTVDHVRRPRKVAALQGKKIVSIATGSLHCVACSDAGEVFTWGDNDEGQLGDGTVSAVQRPRLVQALQGKHIVKVTCGSAHTLALSTIQMSEGARPPPNPPLEYDFVRDLPLESLHSRLVLVHHFSELLCPCLAMLPMTGDLSLGALKDVLVYSIKEAAFRKVIQTTMVRDKQHGPVIELNRIQVKRSRSRSGGGLAGVDGMKSVFGQMVQKLPLLNQEALYLPHRVWKVKFVGESVDDCGGGFSESIAEMCDELQNGCVPLLIQTPNGRGEAGTNRDCFLLDPTLTSVLQMNMFRFLGVLMGIAVRTGSPLSVSLAEPVWRQLAGETLRPSDLTEVDRDYVASLICIRDMEDDPRVFQTLELPFSTPSAKGHEVPLSTRYTRITPQNKHEYVRLALNYRLHEFDEQVKAVRDGMSKVIPVPLLSLFSASQLQAMVCGSPEIPLALLKSVATYKGVDPNAPLVQWFWEVMEEFSNQERSLFLRFVWGRTRLPRTIPDFRGRDFVLQVLDKYNPADHFLPESYTCFFLLKMPRYSCKSVLLEKLKYAIYFCKSIDTDEYARVAMVEPTEATVSENNSDVDSEISEEM